MERQPVSSSNIASIGYDPSTSTLEVEFIHGGVYQYFDVPQSYYDSLMQADSKGTYLSQNIKVSFRYARV